jgi:CheY-specific phosphatase CheX
VHFEIEIEAKRNQFMVRPRVTLEPGDKEKLLGLESTAVRMGGRSFDVARLAARPPFFPFDSREEADALSEAISEQLRALQDQLGDPVPRARPESSASPDAPAGGSPNRLTRALHKAFEAVVPQVFRDMGLSAEPGPDDAELEVGAVMGLRGAVQGAIGLATSRTVARQIHTELTGEDLPEGDPEHGQTLCELLNIMLGATGGVIHMRDVRPRLPVPGVVSGHLVGLEPMRGGFHGPFGSVSLLCSVRRGQSDELKKAG